VALLLRKIKRERWRPLEDETWLPPGEILADPMADLGTSRGSLSVWFVDESRSNLDRILSALAGNCDYVSTIDYLLFDSQVLVESSLKLLQSEGNTPDTEANKVWHRDIVELSAGALAALGRRVFRCEKGRRLDRQILDLLLQAVRSRWIDPGKLKPEVRNRLS